MTLREFCRLFAHEVEDGFIIISDKPGIGIELAEDAMEKYPFSVLEKWVLSRLTEMNRRVAEFGGAKVPL